MERQDIVEKVRAFNRFYLPALNLLGNHYLGSEFGVTYARIFYEIYCREGCNAAYLAKSMNIDKGYVSRILASHEQHGFLARVAPETDRRSQKLYLTDEGKRRAEDFILKSNRDIGGHLEGLSDRDLQQLGEAMDTIIRLLKKGESAT